jgi:hypothetical protein
MVRCLSGPRLIRPYFLTRNLCVYIHRRYRNRGDVASAKTKSSFMNCDNARTAAQEAQGVDSTAFASVATTTVAPETVESRVMKLAGIAIYPRKTMKRAFIRKATLCLSYMCLLSPIRSPTRRFSKSYMRVTGLLGGLRSKMTIHREEFCDSAWQTDFVNYATLGYQAADGARNNTLALFRSSVIPG